MGRPVLKLKYFYLALATLGLGQIFGIVVTQLGITGGANGFGPIPSLNLFGFEVSTYMRQYYVVWIVVLVILLFTDRALKYRFGRSLRSLATSEIAASTLGVRNANWKLVAFVVGAMYCGLAGGLFAFVSVAIMPGSFGFTAAVLPVVMMLIGGDQSIWGGVVGAIVLTWVINGFPQLQQYSGVVVLGRHDPAAHVPADGHRRALLRRQPHQAATAVADEGRKMPALWSGTP